MRFYGRLLIGLLRRSTRGRGDLLIENLVLGQQLAVYARQRKRPRLRNEDRLFGSVKTEGVNGTEIAASSCHLPQAAATSEISERQRVRKSRRCSASGTWGSPRRRPLKYCCVSSNAAQNRDADSKFPKPRIG